MRLLILDRDGVINEDSPDYIKSVDEFVFLPGSVQAMADLSRAGYTLVVATNQSGLGRGLFDLDDLEAMHEKLNAAVNEAGGEIAGIFYCPHTPDDDCDCRKPKPGLLDAIADELGMPVKGAWIIGDSLRDLEAGIARGCKPILVRTGKGAASEKKLAGPALAQTPVFDDLAAATAFLVSNP
ncbi:MAG: D-glycero-beta-D-manno-heptose 1,7-bisphosphate 7-phosphatase [Gammaproteobacteria bacterium]|nr:MAG: D-glycero-beta-D-manno-heptose 1,7-bisphosphate 7-phosphatase [Gammaproteobacteria bacterium]